MAGETGVFPRRGRRGRSNLPIDDGRMQQVAAVARALSVVEVRLPGAPATLLIAPRRLLGPLLAVSRA